jgi:hypothetical protein
VGLAGNSRLSVLYGIDLNLSMGSWRKARRQACVAAGVRYRPDDMRHTFISRLAENPSVREQTIKALAGHASRRMLERNSHTRSQAKQAAIQALGEMAIEPIFQLTGHRTGQSPSVPRGPELSVHRVGARADIPNPLRSFFVFGQFKRREY